MLKWSLSQLYRYKNQPLEFSDELDFSDRITNIDDILEMSKVKVEGECIHIVDDRYQFNMNLSCEMILECARTLEPVPYTVDINVTEIFDTVESDTDDDVRLIEKSTINLEDVIWEDIYLEKPMRIFKEGSSAIIEDQIPDDFYEED